MHPDDLIARLDRFEKTVATCLCILPLLFSAQCLTVSLSAPVFEAMFADFGSKLPGLTDLVIKTAKLWALLALTAPIASLIVARKGRATFSIVFSTATGLIMFIVAQMVTIAMFIPIFELGAVAGNIK